MRASKPLRLRDFVRVGSLYFSVVGYRNERAVKCFLRYAPGDGDRVKDGVRYKKLSHEEAVNYAAARKFFDGSVFRIPHPEIDEVFKPEERLPEVMDPEVRKVVEFFSPEVPLDSMGVTGSRLIGLKGDDSDVDFIVYGEHWFRAREMLIVGIRKGKLSEPDEETWEFIYKKRRVPLPYDVFLIHERRKYHRAFVGSTYFDLLYVRGYGELERDIPEEPGTKLGLAEVVARVTDDSYVFDYPSYYPLDSGFKAVLCFTHTYAGQALRGERIYARGVVEEIDGERYLVVGTSRETQEEFIVSLDLIERSQLSGEFESWLRGLPPLQQRGRP